LACAPCLANDNAVQPGSEVISDPVNPSAVDPKLPAITEPVADWRGARRDTLYFLGYQALVVGVLYALPDEDPVVGKIQDREKLSDQEFFKNAANGDDLLIYQESKLAIIYRASENKLINVGPVSINNTDADQPGVDTEAQSEESGRGE